MPGTTDPWRVAELPVGSVLGEEEVEAVANILRSGELLGGITPALARFEEAFSHYTGARHSISLSSATSALALTAEILGLREGDELIATPLTFRATLLGALARGAKVRFADIDRMTLNIDPQTIEDKITPRTKAIYLVHLGGLPADMDPVMEIAKRHGLVVVDDAAHAPGASYKGRKVGVLGDMTCFAFSTLKNMVTLGEGGMMTTHDDTFAGKCRWLRTMGIIGPKRQRESFHIGPYLPYDPTVADHSGDSFTHDFVSIDHWGCHARMSAPQAEVGLVQLRKLEWMNAMRARVALRYHEGLSQVPGIRLLEVPEGTVNAWHLYPCFIDTEQVRADHHAMLRFLSVERRIQMIQRYFPVHLTNYMRYHGHQYGECPTCEHVWFNELLNFPIHPLMPDEDVDYIVESVSMAILRFAD